MCDFQSQYQAWLGLIEKALPDFFPLMPEHEGGAVVEAARYSLMAGGKRIRPVLALAVADMLGIETDKAMPYACAIEMIHTYSLIHDDLPCMDDDSWRRGRKTCHIVYGEALAVLAGDALLNRAYELLLETIDVQQPASREAALQIASAAGSRGMIGGQTLDLAAEKNQISASEMQKLHMMKTGALLKAPIIAMVKLAGLKADRQIAFEMYAEAIGLAFQIQDDILDVVSDREQMGKTTGKDARDNKSTYVSLYGLEGAREQLSRAIEQAYDHLRRIQEQAGLGRVFLHGMTDYLLNREK